MGKLEELIRRAGNRELGHCPKCRMKTEQLVIHKRQGALFSTRHSFYVRCQRCGYTQEIYETKV